MKFLGPMLVMSALCGLGASVQQHPGHAESKAVVLVSGLGDLHHPVTTSNPEAQKFFDQGLRYIFAFNHEEAARSFQHAAELDPKLAMAYWGIAEAVGPNYNDPGDPDRFRIARDAAQKALSLAQGATPSERGYIAAIVLRFPGEANADLHRATEQYRDAMGKVSKQFPDDLDAAVLFAEAGMLVHPWGLWHPDGTPEAGTVEIVSALESVLRRDPNNVGAIHYYIHAVEASPNPERALAPASRLAALAPAAGHLVHMPGHVYIRTGDYDAAIKTNQKAVDADHAYMQSGGQGMYLAMYLSHNLHFISECASMEGNYVEAQRAATALAANVKPYLKDMPFLEAFMTVSIQVEARFHKWDQILALPQPDPTMQATTSVWHFARGMAFAAKGKIAEAEAEYKIVADAEEHTPPDVVFAPPINNKTKDVLKIAENVLGAEIAMAKHDPKAAVARLRQAVAIQDSLNYNEPPDWSYPVRETLGAVLLTSGNAQEAEKVFRDDLERTPRNPRSLFGLREALKAQGRGYDAQFVDKQFQSAWKSSTVLKAEDLI